MLVEETRNSEGKNLGVVHIKIMFNGRNYE
jgi:hypothetical protein